MGLLSFVALRFEWFLFFFLDTFRVRGPVLFVVAFRVHCRAHYALSSCIALTCIWHGLAFRIGDKVFGLCHWYFCSWKHFRMTRHGKVLYQHFRCES